MHHALSNLEVVNMKSKDVKIRKIAIVSVIGLALVLSMVTGAQAITNGQPDGNEHPYVGLVVFDDADGLAGRCSGSLLSENIVLTAGHCTVNKIAARVWFDEDVEDDEYYPYSGPTSFDGTPYTHENRDIGVVVLNEPVPYSVVGEYAQLPEPYLVDTLENKELIDLVGYGVQWREKGLPPSPDLWTGDLVRLTAPSELLGGFVHSDEFIKIALNPGGGSGGTCFGDSGGPDLLRGEDIVLAVNSYVNNANCAGIGYSTRVDIPEVLNWINNPNT
jgi:hypothetical protein